MHRAGMRRRVQRGAVWDIAVSDAVLTHYIVSASYGERWRLLLCRPACGLPDQPGTHMHNTCCIMCSCPLEKVLSGSKNAKLTTNDWFYLLNTGMVSSPAPACCKFSRWTKSIWAMRWRPWCVSVGDLVKEQGLLCIVEFAHPCTDRASSLREQIYRKRSPHWRRSKPNETSLWAQVVPFSSAFWFVRLHAQAELN